MAERVLKCDDLTYLEDLPIFSEKVNSKLHNEKYIVYEEYQEREYNKSDDGIEIKISGSNQFGDKINDYTLKIDPSNNSVISYKFEGPAMFSYIRPITRSSRTIFNRESKSIGYNTKTNEIMSGTRVVRHIFFDKVSDELIRVTKEFFKSSEKGQEDIPLNAITNIHLNKKTENDKDSFKYGTEEFTMFDVAGNIEEYNIADAIYGETISGEFITLNIDYKYTSSDDYKEIIIPQMNIVSDNKIQIRYIKKNKPYDDIATEEFDISEGGLLIPTYIKNLGIEYYLTYIPENGSFDYRSVSVIDDETYEFCGNTFFPLSQDMLAYCKANENITLSLNSMFNNIYDIDNGLDCYYNSNKIKSAKFKLNGDDADTCFSYKYDDYGIINSVISTTKNGNEPIKELCKYQVSKLPNGHNIIESCFLIRPVFPYDKKSIFYIAAEISKNNDGKPYICSEYKVTAIV